MNTALLLLLDAVICVWAFGPMVGRWRERRDAGSEPAQRGTEASPAVVKKKAALVLIGTGDTNKQRGGLWVAPENVAWVRGFGSECVELTEVGLKTGAVLTCTLPAWDVVDIVREALP